MIGTPSLVRTQVFHFFLHHCIFPHLSYLCFVFSYIHSSPSLSSLSLLFSSLSPSFSSFSSSSPSSFLIFLPLHLLLFFLFCLVTKYIEAKQIIPGKIQKVFAPKITEAVLPLEYCSPCNNMRHAFVTCVRFFVSKCQVCSKNVNRRRLWRRNNSEGSLNTTTLSFHPIRTCLDYKTGKRINACFCHHKDKK